MDLDRKDLVQCNLVEELDLESFPRDTCMLAHPPEECTLIQVHKGLGRMGCVLVQEELALELSVDWRKYWRNHQSSTIPSWDNQDQERQLTNRLSVDLYTDLL